MPIENIQASKNPRERFKEELSSVGKGNFITKLLSPLKLKKEVAELGLALVDQDENGYYEREISLGSVEAAHFKTLLKSDIWQDPAYYALLEYFFGAEKAPLVVYAWNLMPYKMYQTGYSRRSFRAPENERYVLLNQVNFLRSILIAPSRYDETGRLYYDSLTLEQEIIYDYTLTQGNSKLFLWSAAIDLGNNSIYQLAEDIIYNKHPEGKVSRNLIKALLNSENEKCWVLVEQLLLSAQRQEGLRQTILEALDETSVGALKYMIKVIMEHKLSRFSSVVRAVGTWAGLGWEAEKETTVRSILMLADQYLSHPEEIEKAILSKNNNEVYMALWAQGVLDVDKTVPYLHTLLDQGSIEKKSLALKFATETGNPFIKMPLYLKAVKNGNLQLLAFALSEMEVLLRLNVKSRHYTDNPDYADLFETIYDLTQQITIKTQSFEGKVFSWLNTKFEKDSLYACLIYLIGDEEEKLNLVLQEFDTLAIRLREELTKTVLKEYFSYYGYRQDDNNPVPTAFQRSFALKILKDRGETMVTSAINLLGVVKLQAAELDTFREMLKRKNATLRKKLLELLLIQSDEVFVPFIADLLQNGDLEQRLASLELMMRLQKEQRIVKDIEKLVATYEKNTKVTEKEKGLLEQLQPSNAAVSLTEANGYGFYQPENISAFALPLPDQYRVYNILTKKEKYGFSKSLSGVKKDLDNLVATFGKHADYEYEIENFDNTKSVVLLGDTFRYQKYERDGLTAVERFENYPLHEIWEAWFITSGLTASDLFLLTLATRTADNQWKDFLEKHVFYGTDIIPVYSKLYGDWNNPYKSLLEILADRFPFEGANDFIIDATSVLYNELPKSIIDYKYIPDNNSYYYRRGGDGDGWQSTNLFDVFLYKLKYDKLTDEQVPKLWSVYRWRQFNGLPENIKLNMPPLKLYCLAFKLGIITEGEMYEGILLQERIGTLTADRNFKYNGDEKLPEQFPFLKPMIDHIRNRFLDVELKRGDTNTSVSHFVQYFQNIFGMNRFVGVLSGFGKANVYRGYIYFSGSDMNKQMLFSKLLKGCFPAESDTQETFNELVAKSNISETKLVQAAVYAPQWQKYISSYLGWKGLDSAIWWMHAHTKSNGYQYQNSEAESEIAKYSAVELHDFSDGAVDKAWFNDAYKQLGKAKWEILYDSAKYITDGNGHRRAKLYADTLLDDLKIREVTAKVKDKRDQDYLRVYGLVPLSKANPEKDVLNRYEYLQQFKKESKEFGSMRQTSEALAFRIAMENLARNAGYPDPLRLSWAMETKQVQDILSKNTQVEIDGITVGLIIEESGKAELVTFNGDKQLKSIPAKIKKHPLVIELTGYRKTLREQWTRSRKSLEEAMIRGDEFLHTEVANLFNHPVISNHVSKLVFVTNSKEIGFFKNELLVNGLTEPIAINENHTLRIAHCVDMHESGKWVAFQSYCFDQALQQPFKQVFRELYVPTADELAEKSVSRRYAGHQVNPTQTLALLKGRGWKADYEEGLQKVFHKEGFQVKLYAAANWFSPADVESPVLETIEFHSLKDFKNVAFADIDSRIFSEVMRDIDLVVSVAHVGGTDPEASHSSIEMRSVLLRETLRLFKLPNVEIKGSHALIKGKLGDYSIHIGSAVVHQTPGAYLSVLPVHSQHRGRLFLPFADDDPKSAEFISKVLLFAKDDQIQDPTILSQIVR